jgi:hypothetical protein
MVAGLFKGGHGAKEGADMGVASRQRGTCDLARCSGGGDRAATARS